MNFEPTSIKDSLILRFIVVSCVILYTVIRIFDTFSLFSDGNSDVLFRYIPVAFTSAIATYVFIRIKSKKLLLSNLDVIKKQLIIAPIIVMVIIFLFGIYSVNSNVKSIKENPYYSMIDENVRENMLEKAKSHAIVKWIITSVVYVGVAEIVVFKMKNIMQENMTDDLYSYNGRAEMTNNSMNANNFMNASGKINTNDFNLNNTNGENLNASDLNTNDLNINNQNGNNPF